MRAGVALAALFHLACGDNVPASDALVAGAADAGVRDGAAPCEPTEHTVALGGVLDTGAVDDGWGQGPEAWVTRRKPTQELGDMLHVEAYRDLFEGSSVAFEAFQNWQDECAVCVFLGVRCGSSITYAGSMPVAPQQCEHVFMLERGLVELSSFEPIPEGGSLAGTVAPLDGEDRVHLVEVDVALDTGRYGERVPGGQCLLVEELTFAGSW